MNDKASNTSNSSPPRKGSDLMKNVKRSNIVKDPSIRAADSAYTHKTTQKEKLKTIITKESGVKQKRTHANFIKR